MSNRTCSALALLISVATLVGAARTARAVPFGVSDDGAVVRHPTLLTLARDRLGAGWVRFMVQPGDELRYDSAIRNADQAGMRIIVNLAGAPRDSFPGWARWAAARWPAVDAWSIENEPDLYKAPVCQYMRLYERARREIRKVSSAPVLFGEISPHGWRWVELARFCRPLQTRPDGVAVHPYQGSDPLSTKVGKPWSVRSRRWRDSVTRERWTSRSVWIGIGRLNRFKRVLRRSRLNAPLWITEFGWLARATSPQQQAAWWPRAFEQADRMGAKVLIAHGVWSSGEHRNWDSSLPDQVRAVLGARPSRVP